MLEERGIEHAAGSQAWLRRTLEEIVSQVRRLLDVTGVSFLVVDAAGRMCACSTAPTSPSAPA